MNEVKDKPVITTRRSGKLTSLLWRSLAAYGRFKYQYLLPLYRSLGLMRDRPDSSPSKTLRLAHSLARKLNRVDENFYSDQLRSVLERVRAGRGAVIFLPSVGWNIHNAQRVHHLAREFARSGIVSIFDSSHTFDDIEGFEEIENDLFLYRGPENILPQIPDPLLWAVTYNFDQRSKYPRSSRVVYDWIDDFKVFPHDRAFLERNHARALEEADLVASVALRLHEEAARARADALYLPNAVEYSRFADDSARLPDDADIERIRREGKPVAGYYGAMAEWLDYELIRATAALRPDWNFLFIGPAYDNSLRESGRAMLKLRNVCWTGPRPYSSLPAFLRLFDVAMIPFVLNDITRATSPLKLYEYFAAARPVVTTRMPECVMFEEVQIVSYPEDFSSALDLARRRGEDAAFRERLKKLGRENSWTVRVETVIERLRL